MNYYIYENSAVFSEMNLKEMKEITEAEFFNLQKDKYYYIYSMDKRRSKNGFVVRRLCDLTLVEESADDIFLFKSDKEEHEKLSELIESSLVIAVNGNYDNWKELISDEKNDCEFKDKRVNLLGLGDVGSTLSIGLKLLGKGTIKEIGIYDLNPERVSRWELELNQIIDPSGSEFPRVIKLKEEDLFNCDMFIFCASKYVPEIGSDVKDVRMAQLAENLKIVKIYSEKARDVAFKGIFAVVSDPVDLLCAGVYHYSNLGKDGCMDCKGLFPYQIKGYGLGVMYGRAKYYADSNNIDFSKGRAYGPHGKDLIVANDVFDYDDELSRTLTNLTINANMEVRSLGFKPYVAPALSSGAISIINTLKGEWNFSTVFMGSAYFGCRNRIVSGVADFERIDYNKDLYKRILSTYKELTDFGIKNFDILR